MFCYAFIGDGDRTLGVLSVDFKVPLSLDNAETPTFPSADGTSDIPLDRKHFRLLLSSVQTILEAFQNSERRVRYE